MDADEILNTLSDSRMVSLNNLGDRWEIVHKKPGGGTARFDDADFDRLVDVWAKMVELEALIPPAGRCPMCGYTEEDKRTHGDHHLCERSGG
jgi:hypothetical protein